MQALGNSGKTQGTAESKKNRPVTEVTKEKPQSGYKQRYPTTAM